jgi:hypothetical protein
MANHGKTVRTEAKAARHYAKPSRAARYARRWDERLNELRAYLVTRDYAFRVGPFVTRVWPHRDDVPRVFRIAEYLARRAERAARAA